MPEAINSFRGEYSFLSNFYPAPTEYQGIIYPSAENAYQASKTLGDRKPFESMTPTAAKRVGRQVVLRPDWDTVQVGVMRKVVFSKFSRNPDLAKLLLATGSAELIEGNTWNDTFWGVCKGKGENHLGKILMDCRKQLWWNALPQGERVIYQAFGMIAKEAKTDPLCKQVWHSIRHMMAIATGAE